MIPIVAVTTHNFLLWLGSFLGFALVVLSIAALRIKGSTLWQKLGASLDARSARIDAQLRMAQENQAAAQKARDEAAAEIAQARTESVEIVDRARKMQESLRAELAQAAEEDSNRIVGQARDEIEAERNRAILALRTKAADAAVEAAREVLRQTVDEKVDRDILTRALAHPSDANGDVR